MELEGISDIWEMMDEGIEAMFSGHELPNIGDVADVVDGLSGCLPGSVRCVSLVGFDVQYIAHLNDVVEHTQSELLDMLGLGDLAQPSSPKAAAG